VEALPEVTIVVIAHAERDDLGRCFGSIREHAELATQTVLVDNASTDDTVSWVRANHPEVEIVELPENIGVAARQHGLERARGPLTMFLDSDAELTAGALPAMHEAFERNPGWGLIGPRLVDGDGELQLSCRRFPPRTLPLVRRPPLSWFLDDSRMVRHHLMTDIDHTRARPVLYVLGACQIFRSSLASAAGGFPDSIFLGPDDIEWCIRIRDAGGEVVYFPGATVIHRYQRRSAASPVSRVALRHLRSFAAFQWDYRKRRRELIRLQDELDRRYEGSGAGGEAG
jgi:N-acetylglucosaminyl-diphospho-decaprenol L-rhamnosyltransferase